MWPVTGVSCCPAIFFKISPLACNCRPVKNPANVTFYQLFLFCLQTFSFMSFSFPRLFWLQKKQKNFLSISIPNFLYFSHQYSVTMNLWVKDGESRGARGKNGKWERDKGADGMDAKNQQSHVRLIKINSFSLHSLRLSLFLYWRAKGVFSKCFLRNA